MRKILIPSLIFCATTATADFATVAQHCVDFHKDGHSVFADWQETDCTVDACLPSYPQLNGQGDLADWIVQAVQIESGALSGQRHCNVLQTPDVAQETFQKDGESWIDDQITQGNLRKEGRFILGCGADNQSFTFGLSEWDGEYSFSSVLIPNMHPSCSE